jgi:hypothetical protein
LLFGIAPQSHNDRPDFLRTSTLQRRALGAWKPGAEPPTERPVPDPNNPSWREHAESEPGLPFPRLSSSLGKLTTGQYPAGDIAVTD